MLKRVLEWPAHGLTHTHRSGPGMKCSRTLLWACPVLRTKANFNLKESLRKFGAPDTQRQTFHSCPSKENKRDSFSSLGLSIQID